MTRITITTPDDWHLHLRDSAAMQAVAPFTAAQFARAVVMPNLSPPVTTVEQALAYRQRIKDALPTFTSFQPLMTLYLTDKTSPDEIEKAAHNAAIIGVKLYPAGATTNSDFGVTGIEKTYDAIAAMERTGLPLLVHGEVTEQKIDVFDREKVFIDRILAPLLQKFPKLRLVLEHVTTEDGVRFVKQSGNNVAATITPQHLLLNRNALFQGGIRPHLYCLPILKSEQHRVALVEAATSGNPKFFLGTDSAPHAQNKKETACGCAGVFSAHAAIELYAEAFEQAGALDKLEGFASHFGADFYRLPRNSGTITLVKEPWTVPTHYPFGDQTLIPFRAGETNPWKMKATQ